MRLRLIKDKVIVKSVRFCYSRLVEENDGRPSGSQEHWLAVCAESGCRPLPFGDLLLTYEQFVEAEGCGQQKQE